MRFFDEGVSELDAAAAAERIGDGRAFVLDVRDDHEYAAGHIPAAINNIPMAHVGARLHELPKGADVVTVCRSGAVAIKRARPGYRINNLNGGMVAWQAAGAPTEPAGASVA